MSEHVTVAALWAKRHGTLAPERSHAIAAHLAHCSSCSQLDRMVARLEESAGRERAPRHPPSISGCLSLETLANYSAGALSLLRRWRVEKHIAGCALCRAQLAELLRLEASPLSPDALAMLESLPSISTREWASDLVAQAAEMGSPRVAAAPGARRRRSAGLRWQPAWAWGLAILVTLFINAVVFGPMLMAWRSDVLAGRGLVYLEQERGLDTEDLRLAGNFIPVPGSAAPSARTEAGEEKAAIAFANSLRWQADNPAARRGQALVSYFDEEYAAARHLLQQLQQEKPASAAIANDLGVVAAALGKPDTALHHFERALALQADLAEARFNRAALLQKLGRTHEAKAAWDSYFELQEAGQWRRIALDYVSRLR